MKAPSSTIPFVKNHNFNYSYFFKWAGEHAVTLGWVLFALVAIFVVTAVSNGANLVDGIDGQATGVCAINMIALAIMCYLGGNVIYAGYLNIMYIPDSGELLVYAAAFIGATVGFLWYNFHPAEVFMGDTGSLFLGGAVCALAFALDMPLILILVGMVYIIETLSVILQVGYFKLTHGKRIFKMSPIHHHFEMCGWKEVKIVVVFSTVSALMCVLAWIGIQGRIG